MHFGQSTRTSYQTPTLIIALALLILSACKENKKSYVSFSTPNQGANINLGDSFKVQLDIDEDINVESITYWVDDKVVGKQTTKNPLDISTKGLSLGYKMLSAAIKVGEDIDTVTTNIVLVSSVKPQQLTYRVEKTFPHDTSAYTEGLAYVDGKLLESTGEKGRSELKYVDLNTGKTLQKTTLGAQYFGEGSLKIGDKIIMLTWQENTGFVFDAKTLKQLGTFPYENSREGWGLTFDGKNILRTDGSNRIWRMNKDTYKEEGYIEVYDAKGAVTNLNELEYINGKIYANVYLTNKILVINPNNGVVEAELDLSALVPKNFYKTQNEIDNNVLNGIAWDAAGKRLFVGGKKWPKLYQIKIN